MAHGDEGRNRQDIAPYPDGTLFAVWFPEDEAPRVVVKHGHGLHGPVDWHENTSDRWSNSHAMHWDRFEVLWQPPVDESAEVARRITEAGHEADWLIESLREQGLTVKVEQS